MQGFSFEIQYEKELNDLSEKRSVIAYDFRMMSNL